MRHFSFIEKASAAFVASGATYLAVPETQPSEQQPTFHGILHELGALGLVGSTGVLVLGATTWGISYMIQRNYEKKQDALENIRARLPVLREGFTSDDLKNSAHTVLGGTDHYPSEEMSAKLAEFRFMHGRADSPIDPKPTDYDAYTTLATISDTLVAKRLETWRSRQMPNIDAVRGQLLEDCLVLDQIASISDDCPKTPETGDAGKYWFDYIDRQAQLQLVEA